MSSVDDNRVVNMHLQVPVWVKRFVVEAAEREGLSMSGFCGAVLVEASKGVLGIPLAPPAVCGVPSVQDVLRSYVEGSGRLIGPCGERWPCGFDSSESLRLDGLEFCNVCSIRVN